MDRGKNITIEYRFAENKGSEHLLQLATELVRQKVDLIVVNSVASASAAKSATATIPIVMAAGSDPVAAGLMLVWRGREVMSRGSPV
jgi:putative ABC transport system substrate-binding protein